MGTKMRMLVTQHGVLPDMKAMQMQLQSSKLSKSSPSLQGGTSVPA